MIAYDPVLTIPGAYVSGLVIFVFAKHTMILFLGECSFNLDHYLRQKIYFGIKEVFALLLSGTM